jgi:hypothetical protein
MAESLLNTPLLWINTYLKEKLELGLGFDTIPFYPTSPTALDDLTQTFPDGGVMCVYDRMFRMRRRPFPHIKTEQVLYYFYSTTTNKSANMIQIQENVLRLMDREDESAQEMNAWALQRGTINVGTAGDPINVTNKFYFHRFKVYQLEEARDIVDFGTARTYAGNKIIIDYEYHQHDDVLSSNS